MKKNAFMFLTHGRPEILKQTIETLDYPENDIFIHVDKSTPINEYEKILSNLVNCSCYFTNKRIDVKWGDFSIVEAELELMKKVSETANYYQRIHLLSGVDVLIKPYKIIDKYFDEHPKTEFVHFWNREEQEKKAFVERYRFYDLYVPKKRTLTSRILYHAVRKMSIYTQKILKINRDEKNSKEIKMGSQWFSITYEFMKEVLSQESWIRETYEQTLCPDESFIQTILYNNKQFFKQNFSVEFNNDYDSIKRLIKFVDGKPLSWSLTNKKEIESSTNFFARKVSIEDFSEEFISFLNDIQKG